MDGVAQLAGDDTEIVAPGGFDARGGDAMKQLVETYVSAFPDC